MRTAFFVDGYNLFYGLLAGTQYKWLDLPSLLSHIGYIENPASILASVDYFTPEELQAHQFPARVRTHKAPAIKPEYW